MLALEPRIYFYVTRLENRGHGEGGLQWRLRVLWLLAGEAGEGKRVVWVVARQHPGESMAEWFVEGMLRALLDPHAGLPKDLLKKAVFYVVRLRCLGGLLARAHHADQPVADSICAAR